MSNIPNKIRSYLTVVFDNDPKLRCLIDNISIELDSELYQYVCTINLEPLFFYEIVITYSLLDDCSVVTAPYQLSDNQVGVLGVIGPKRMAYDRVVPIVDLTAKLLGKAVDSK